MTEQAVNNLIQEKMLAADPDLGPILVLNVNADCDEVYWYHEYSEEIRHSRIAIIEDGSAVVTECLGSWDRSI